jgi:hypothetical protein
MKRITNDDSALAKALRQEADALTPEFNALLHERIMRRVRGAAERASRQSAYVMAGEGTATWQVRWLWRLGFGGGLAAACVVAVLAMWQLNRPAEEPAASLVSLPTPAGLLEDHVAPVGEEALAMLDDDTLEAVALDLAELGEFVRGQLALAQMP